MAGQISKYPFMNHSRFTWALVAAVGATLPINPLRAGDAALQVPRFSTDYMDKNIAPTADFYHFAAGTWIKNNPVPPDKSRWASFSELQERNWHLIHGILDGTIKASVQENSPADKVRAFYLSAIDTN